MATGAFAGSQRRWRELSLEGGSGAEGLFKSVLAGAFKASGLISCREDLECQDHLPVSLLARQLVLLCPSLWHHVMLRAGVWVDGACQAPRLCLTFSLALAQPGHILGFSLL